MNEDTAGRPDRPHAIFLSFGALFLLLACAMGLALNQAQANEPLHAAISGFWN